ncbi:MAG: DUF3006 domain-containing protein [Oscillospiraceae bacterium]|nr:DUF3006 domain-containing protein [Oscillospiraceae bacterium]
MYYSVDRIDEGWAVLIDDEENRLEIEVEKLPGGVGAADMLWFENGVWRLDGDEKARRQEEIRALQRQLTVDS